MINDNFVVKDKSDINDIVQKQKFFRMQTKRKNKQKKVKLSDLQKDKSPYL